jgi:hypothetical protein
MHDPIVYTTLTPSCPIMLHPSHLLFHFFKKKYSFCIRDSEYPLLSEVVLFDTPLHMDLLVLPIIHVPMHVSFLEFWMLYCRLPT